jgi:hypothetical protein
MRSSPLGKRLRDLTEVPAIPDEKALEDERLPGARRTDHDLNAIAADAQPADHLGPVGADRGPGGKRLMHGARLHDAGANGALVEGAVDENAPRARATRASSNAHLRAPARRAHREVS